MKREKCIPLSIPGAWWLWMPKGNRETWVLQNDCVHSPMPGAWDQGLESTPKGRGVMGPEQQSLGSVSVCHLL